MNNRSQRGATRRLGPRSTIDCKDRVGGLSPKMKKKHHLPSSGWPHANCFGLGDRLHKHRLGSSKPIKSALLKRRQHSRMRSRSDESKDAMFEYLAIDIEDPMKAG